MGDTRHPALASGAEIVDDHRGDQQMTRLNTVYPGEVLKADFMEPFALSATALAKPSA